MAGSRVDDAAALIESDVARQDSRYLDRQERMLKLHALEIAAFERSANFGFLDVALRLQRSDAIRREQQRAFFGFHYGVFEIGVKREPAVVRNRPWSGRPDDRPHVAANF